MLLRYDVCFIEYFISNLIFIFCFDIPTKRVRAKTVGRQSKSNNDLWKYQ